MTLLSWKPAYSLAIPSVDLEHRQMITLINECHDRMGSHADDRDVENFLGDIYAGISAHFALEEQLMKRAAYPEYEAHKADHEDLLDEIRDLMDFYVLDPESGKERLKEQLSNWFSHHFSTFDARLHDQLPH